MPPRWSGCSSPTGSVTASTRTVARCWSSPRASTMRACCWPRPGCRTQRAVGFEMLDKEQGIGTSQFMETARYRHSLEGELARTIGSIASVRAARVHLAMPERSAFVRDQRRPSASVLLELQPGRTLQEGQVRAIGNLVASSVPDLDLGGRHHRGPEGQAGVEFRRRRRGGGRHQAARVHRASSRTSWCSACTASSIPSSAAAATRPR